MWLQHAWPPALPAGAKTHCCYCIPRHSLSCHNESVQSKSGQHPPPASSSFARPSCLAAPPNTQPQITWAKICPAENSHFRTGHFLSSFALVAGGKESHWLSHLSKQTATHKSTLQDTQLSQHKNAFNKTRSPLYFPTTQPTSLGL